jgi:hypothetical protein
MKIYDLRFGIVPVNLAAVKRRARRDAKRRAANFDAEAQRRKDAEKRWEVS